MKTDKEYLEESSNCPKCNSSDCEAGNVDFEGNQCYVEVTCNECGLVWFDYYELQGYQVKEVRKQGN